MVRIVGHLDIQANAQGFLLDFNAGISLANSGIIPSPQGDLDERWLWWTGGHVPDVVAGDSQWSRSLSLDVKVRRSFREGDDQLRLQVQNTSGAGDISFALAIRHYTLLP